MESIYTQKQPTTKTTLSLHRPPPTAHYTDAGVDGAGGGERHPAGAAEAAATPATATFNSGIPCGADPRHLRPSPVPSQPTTNPTVFDCRKVSWSDFASISRLSCWESWILLQSFDLGGSIVRKRCFFSFFFFGDTLV